MPEVPTAQPPFRISLAMIVRDEARCITRCLESVRDLVDEMVVLDTGSIDDTVALALAAGAEVHHFTWVDDFAAARNAALALCTGDWRLVMDADEWLADGADLLGRLRSEAPTFVGVVEVESETNDGQVGSFWQERIFPAGVRYEGRVHEQPVHDLRHRRLPVRLAHDGYLPEQLQRKAGRNRRLLHAALRKDPRDAYLRYQLGKDNEAAGEHADAAAAYAIAYRTTTSDQSAPPWRHELVVRYLYALGQTGRTQEAVDVANAEMPHWGGSADFWFELGHVLLKHALAHPADAGELLPLIESSWIQCLELGDTPQFPGAIRGKGSHLAAQNLVMFYEVQGDEANAARYRPYAVPPILTTA